MTLPPFQQQKDTYMVKVDAVSRSFGSTLAVDSLSFAVEPGEVFALLGPNGAGKTTTIKMILGLLKADTGAITFQGQPVTVQDNSYKSRIGYVPENGALYENLTAREFLHFVGALHHCDPDTVERKSEELLAVFDLSQFADKMMREFSRGMKQKTLILSALMHDPDLIILDEPFSGLDTNASSIFKEIIRAATLTGKAVIFCSHVLEVVERIVDRALIVKDGKALAMGTPEEIMLSANAETLERAFNTLTGAKEAGQTAQQVVDIIRSSS
jgi:ABC-2 type transport system ATP-binding protein